MLHIFVSQWATPTPIPMGTPSYDLGIDPQQIGQEFAGTIIQGWNLFNSQTFSDVLFFILLFILILGGIALIRSRLETL